MVAATRHVMVFIFGMSLMAYGCSETGLVKYHKVAAATTQAASDVGTVSTVVAAATPGTPISGIALIVTAISGGLIAAEKILTPIVNKLSGKDATFQPSDIGVPNGSIPSDAILGTITNKKT